MKKNFKKDSKDKAFTKPMFELIDPVFMENIANVLTFGANKYGLYNWKSAKQQELHHLTGAIYRHLNKYRQGELIDLESNLPHMAHLTVNAMFLDYFARKNSWCSY